MNDAPTPYPYCGCGCDFELQKYKEDCYFYGETHDMGATIRYCTRKEIKWGDCPCENCHKFLSKSEADKIVRKTLLENTDVKQDSMEEQKEYAIEADCMYDREHLEWVTTRWQCGCCHAEVQRTDTECWHCRSKLNGEPA